MALRAINDPDPPDELSRVRAALRHADAELATARADLVLAEGSAQRANDFFDAVLAASPDHTFVIDQATGAVRYNSRSTDCLGRTTDHMAAMSHTDHLALSHPDDEARMRGSDIAAALLADGQVLELRYRGLHIDGDWRWLSRRVTPFRRGANGTILEILSVVRDITDVVAAEDLIAEVAEINERRRLAHELTERADDQILIVGDESSTIDIEQVAGRVLDPP